MGSRPPGNLGDPSVSTDISGSGTGTQLPGTHGLRVEADGGKLRRRGGIAKRRQRSAAKGTGGSRSAPYYRGGRGTIPRDPAEGEGAVS